MLDQITIENYALIEHLNIDFAKGFSVITGETGAGKSILLGALGLIIGNRADSAVLKNKDRKCVVEGHFRISSYGLKWFFDLNQLDYEEVCILRREINKSGKSRAFINDTPVNLATIKQLGERLINIHSQHTTLTLNSHDFQLAVLDNYCKQAGDVDDYSSLYKKYLKLKVELSALEEREANAKKDQDYYQFLYDEIENAGLGAVDQSELESELEVLQHAEEIKSSLYSGVQQLQENDRNVLEVLRRIANELSAVSAYHKEIEGFTERLESNIIDLKDLVSEFENLEESINVNPADAERISNQLDVIYALQQKHRLDTVEQLMALKEELEIKLSNIDSLGDQIEEVKKDLQSTGHTLKEKAEQLSDRRMAVFDDFSSAIMEVLVKLGMPDSLFRIKHEVLNEPGPDGIDKISFLFSANKGSEPGEINKVASGGELSRLMLAVKSLISMKNLLPTIVFDEIDMGVSGKVADKLGGILRQMSENMQVITITHLPQIASQGEQHFVVYKKSKGDTTTSHIEQLNDSERITEIAKMLSGEQLSDTAIANARAMMKN